MAIASVRYWQGRFDECIEWCQRAIDEAERAGDRNALGHAYHLLHLTYTDLNDDERFDLRDRALPIYEELDDPLGQGNALTNLGIDYARQGEWEDALVVWERGREAFARAGDVVGAAGMTHNIGEHYSNLGRLEEAEAAQAEARRVWTAARYTLGAASATSGLGRTLARHRAATTKRWRCSRKRSPRSRAWVAGSRWWRPRRASWKPICWPSDGPRRSRSPTRHSRASTDPSTRSTKPALQRGRGQALIALGDVERRAGRARRESRGRTRRRARVRARVHARGAGAGRSTTRTKPKPTATRPASSSTCSGATPTWLPVIPSDRSDA